MTQTMIAWSLLVGIVGLLWVLVLSILHDNRRMDHRTILISSARKKAS